MKMRLLVTALAILSWGHLSPVFSVVNSTGLTNSPSIQIPQTSFDFSDLDVRDAQNRKVTTPKAQHDIQRLFEKSLAENLYKNLTPRVRQVEETLRQFFNGAFGFWSRVRQVGQAVGELWFNPKKEFSSKTIFKCSMVAIRSAPRVFRFQFAFTSTMKALMLSSTQILR